MVFQFLQLAQGTHYKRFIDLADMFCVEYKRNGEKQMKKFALRHVAEVLLNEEVNTSVHSAEQDALHSMRLFNLYGGFDKAKLLREAKHKLHQSKPPAKKTEIPDVTDDGVCCCGYRPRRCHCGQPSLTEILEDPEALHRDFPTIDLPCTVSNSSVSSSHPNVGIAAPPSAPPLPRSAVIVTPARPSVSASPTTSSITVPHVNNHAQSSSTRRRTYQNRSRSNVSTYYYDRSGSMYDAMRRGTFNPRENYDDDYDNIFGDFCGNYGGKDS